MERPAPVSVIVPTLNEEGRIGRCLESLRRFSPPWEILVVDGSSEDRTIPIARSFEPESVRVVSASRGRGSQMNSGASLASGDVLLFLHADVALPDDAPRWIESALSDRRVVAGAFRTRTVPGSRRSLVHPLLRLADLRSRYSRLPYGDQALFVRSEIFRRVGGFREIPLMEDLDFVRRLRREGKIRTVAGSVTVSGRRFGARPVHSALSMNLIPLLFRLGISPWLLARLYGNPR